jgi:Dyp-type peroxidase family
VTADDTVPWADVQGLVVSGYGDMHEARYLFLRFGPDTSAAAAWLLSLADRVTGASAPEDQRCVNIAFSANGLAALGLRDVELQTFAVPFQEGMTAEHRQRVLGDVGASGPEHWYWGGTRPDDRAGAADIHALLLLYGVDAPTITALEADETARLTAAGVEVVHRLEPERLPGQLSVGGKFGVEHFGFADGMSQPVIRGSHQDRAIGGEQAKRSVIEAGEFVLGHPNGYGKLTPWPTLFGPSPEPVPFGRDGTYLVVRQLAQDVAAFWNYLDAETVADGDTTAPEDDAATRLAAKLVGRWPSGAPLVLSPHRDDPDLGPENGFGYAEIDPDGERCPFGAHIRRANPRDALGDDPVEALELANLHRLMRRGRVYGKGPTDVRVPDGADRGLIFMALNANIERQFEFVQHTWINNPKFDGLYDEADPLLGNPEGDGRFTVQDQPLRSRHVGLPSFVTVRGGAYLFLPAIPALRTLGRRTSEEVPTP